MGVNIKRAANMAALVIMIKFGSTLGERQV